MATFENSLVPPPNRTAENQQALTSGSVQRGAQVLEQSGCVRLRRRVIAANQANPGLKRSNLDGTGHEFYVDDATGFTPAQ
jgi:hypothetical protein